MFKSVVAMLFILFPSCLLATEALNRTLLLCKNCHGAQGISSIAVYPNLAGQKSAYLKQQLINFRSGKRPSVVMEPMAKSLSDQQIEMLAKYYQGLPSH